MLMSIISLISMMLSNSITLRRDKSILFSRSAILILNICALLAYINLFFLFFSNGIGLFGGLFHSTSITNLFHIFIYLVSAIILLLTSFYPRKVLEYISYIPNNVKEILHKYFLYTVTKKDCNSKEEISNKNVDMITNVINVDEKKKISEEEIREEEIREKEVTTEKEMSETREFPANLPKVLKRIEGQYKIIEYSLIILFVITGALFLICTSDIVSIFLSIELQSYGLYLLSTIYRDSEKATSGGLMYFLLGGLSSCFILLSTGLLYSNSGTTGLDSLYIITNIYDVSKDSLSSLLY